MPDISNLLANLDPSSPTLGDDVWDIARATIPDADPREQHWVNAARSLVAGALLTVIRQSPSHAAPLPSGPDLSASNS